MPVIFIIGSIIGIYSYSIFFLGIFSLLTQNYLITVSILFLISLIIVGIVHRSNIVLPKLRSHKLFSLATFLVVLFSIQAGVNFLGALIPETAFDALWYHLTLPKMYLLESEIKFIPGGLFYYSAMPKLVEMLYIPMISFWGEIAAKVVHFSFGLGTTYVLFRISRLFVSHKISLLVVVLFYSNLVVAWESTTAYVDLGRAFYESLALFAFILWIRKSGRKYIILTGIMMGFAISVKYLALSSFLIFLVIILLLQTKQKLPRRVLGLNSLYYIVPALIIPMPWFIFSYMATGNPFYPSFSTDINAISFSLAQLSPVNIINGSWSLLMRSADPITPVYLITIPLVASLYGKAKLEVKALLIFAFLSLSALYFLPQIGGGRFIIPYLPLYSLIIGIILHQYRKAKIAQILIVCIILSSTISIMYRSLAMVDAVPYLLGRESKLEYLTSNLNFQFGDFYDTDGYFSKNIIEKDKVLLLGFHNLYYLEFPFIHESMIKNGETFTHIATQGGVLPLRFKDFQKVYENQRTGVILYSGGGKTWKY